MIELTSVSKQYGSFWAVRDLSFGVDRSEIIGLVGPNGAGKTTTMKMITGFLAPCAGGLVIDGIDVVSDPTAAQARIGYLPEHNPLYPEMAVQDYLVFIGRMRGLKGAKLKERLAVAVDACGLRDRVTSLIKHLSKGLRQRVGIAQAIIHDPEILILDEPTSGLDPNQIVEIRDLIRTLGQDKTVILSTHILSEVEETCSRALMIVSGRLAVDDRIENLAGSRDIRFAVTGSGGDVVQKIESVDGVASAAPMPGVAVNGTSSFRVVPESEREINVELFRLAVKEGWEISELARERRSLEDVFREASASGVNAS